MDKSGRYLVGCAAGAALLWAGTVVALPTPEASLNTCQKTERTEGRKFIQKTVIAAGTCLKAVAKDVIQNNAGISAGTSSTCVGQFRKINDMRVPLLNKGLKRKMDVKIGLKCTPGAPNVTHVIDDVTDHGAGTVLEKIETENIDLWCKHFGGDGSIDSVPEWVDCIAASHNCEAAAAILAEFPRALEWIDELQDPGNMDSVVAPSSDLTRTTDALGGAALFQGLLDPDGDGVASPHCGGDAVACVTGCCYVENGPVAPAPPDANCFEYTAPAGPLGAFTGACAGPGFTGVQIKTALAGPCGPASPIFGTLCFGPPNKVIIPTESSCP